MNFKKSALASAITLATFATGAAAFDASSWEVSGFVKNETAALQKDGTFHGQRTALNDTGDKNDSGDVIKFENTAKFFVNGDLTENAALHAELNFVYDTEATPNDYQGHMNYSQNDYLRELYIDTLAGDTEVRVGKQQVVWGTADGIKLLDIINPTDYREFAQNTMEDSRIPVWMIKTDTPVGDAASLQFIVSQAEENKIAGLNASGDQGNPYIMKGVDTITGKVNGFLNVAPALGKVAQTFSTAAPSAFSSAAGLVPFTHFTVDYYQGYYSTGSGSLATLVALTQDTGSAGANANNYVTNLLPADDTYSAAAPTSAFEYMPNATFATFNTFASATSSYVVDKPDDMDLNFGGRFKNSLDNGLNYSLNYLYHYDSNPYIDMAWYDASSGQKLDVVLKSNATGSAAMPSTLSTVSRDSVVSDARTATTSVLVTDGTNYYGDYTIAGSSANTGYEDPQLRFTEKYNRIHSLGASFDYTVDTESLGGVVLRGEFLYNKDEMSPIIDKRLLSVGDLTGALQMQKSDMFKYVLGADITVLTNMLVSGQFIQFRNLDYVEESRTCYTSLGTAFDCSKYTGDMATLHMTNGLQKAHENKEFYSLFFSKPFGPNQLGRWNNIFMFEEGGGKWNRFDVEYSFSDELVGSFELNNYWGDANTQFGQMEDSSNIQVGLKYLF